MNSPFWTCSANDAIRLHLVSSMPSESDDSFNPDFTYPFYGEQEELYGFKNLQVDIFFTAASLLPYFNISYSDKKDTATVSSILDPILEKLFPDGDWGAKEDVEWTLKKPVFEEWLKKNQIVKPLGDKMNEYTVKDGDVFEVYKCTFETPGFGDYHRRLQVFLLWFIEGASFIEEDNRWYQKNKNDDGQDMFQILGYVTCYPFFKFPNKTRMRISQFIIFPPFQSSGHGGRMYRFLYDHFFADEDIVEITVEDPTEGFSDMRTKNDLKLLFEKEAFILTPEAPYPKQDDIEIVRTKFKFSGLHMAVLAELYALKYLKTNNAESYKKYRLWVKKRIFLKNEEALAEFDSKKEVKQKLAETYSNVEEDYRRILALM